MPAPVHRHPVACLSCACALASRADVGSPPTNAGLPCRPCHRCLLRRRHPWPPRPSLPTPATSLLPTNACCCRQFRSMPRLHRLPATHARARRPPVRSCPPTAGPPAHPSDSPTPCRLPATPSNPRLSSLSAHRLPTPGFCFVYFKDKRDAEDCIHALDGCARAASRTSPAGARQVAPIPASRHAFQAAAVPLLTGAPARPPRCRREWGRMRRRLRVEFAKNDANVREREKVRPRCLNSSLSAGTVCVLKWAGRMGEAALLWERVPALPLAAGDRLHPHCPSRLLRSSLERRPRPTPPPTLCPAGAPQLSGAQPHAVCGWL